jgi:hypothetical protein
MAVMRPQTGYLLSISPKPILTRRVGDWHLCLHLDSIRRLEADFNAKYLGCDKGTL